MTHYFRLALVAFFVAGCETAEKKTANINQKACLIYEPHSVGTERWWFISHNVQENLKIAMAN